MARLDAQPRLEAETSEHQLIDQQPSDQQISEKVITAVATARGVDETDLDPLYDVIDPDALNSLFEPMADGTRRTGGRLVFAMAGHEVAVTGDGTVAVRPLAGTEAARTRDELSI